MSIFSEIRTGLSDAWNGVSPWGDDLKKRCEDTLSHAQFLQQGIVHSVPAYQAIAENLNAIVKEMQVRVRTIPPAGRPASGGIALTAIKWGDTTAGLVLLDSKICTKVIPRLVNLSFGSPPAVAEAGLELELLGATAAEGALVGGEATGAAALAARAASIAKWAGRVTIVLTVAVVAFEIVLSGVNVAKRRNAIKALEVELGKLEKELAALAVEHAALRKPLVALLTSFADRDAGGAYVKCAVGNETRKIYVDKCLADFDSLLALLKKHDGKVSIADYDALCNRVRSDIRAVRIASSTSATAMRDLVIRTQAQVNMAYGMVKKMPESLFRQYNERTLGRPLVDEIYNYRLRHSHNGKALNATPRVSIGEDGKVYLLPPEGRMLSPRRNDVL